MAQIVKVVDTVRPYRPWHEEGWFVNPSERIFAIEYDGKSVIDLLQEKTSYTLQHAKEIIISEGGYVDDEGIIHKGNAEYAIKHFEDDTNYVEFTRTERVHCSQVRIPWGAIVGKNYLGKTIMDLYFGEEVTKINQSRVERDKDPLTTKDVMKRIAAYNYYVGKDGVIRYVACRKPTKDEDKFGIYDWLVGRGSN